MDVARRSVHEAALLCVGNNLELGEVRQRVLRTRYKTFLLHGVGGFKSIPPECYFAVLVLCHSLSGEECTRAVHEATCRWPEIRVVSIAAPFSSCAKAHTDAVVGALTGPGLLFDTIDRLLQSQQSV